MGASALGQMIRGLEGDDGKAVKCIRRNNKAVSLPAKCFPSLINPDVKCDHFDPGEVLDMDRQTPADDAYFSLSFGNTNQAFVPQTRSAFGERAVGNSIGRLDGN
jgi:hypothetical protein